jgi:hypothetical protein
MKCSVKDCHGEGIITQGGTGKVYCVDHAWEADRPPEQLIDVDVTLKLGEA